MNMQNQRTMWDPLCCAGCANKHLHHCLATYLRESVHVLNGRVTYRYRYRLSHLSQDVVMSIIPRTSNLRRLDVRPSLLPFKGDAWLISVARHCPLLNALCVTDCDASWRAVEALALGCPGLTELIMRNCPQVTDLAIAMLAKCCTALEILSVEATAVTNSGLSTVATSSIAPTLRKLGVSGCKVISDQGIMEIASKCPGLVSIGIAHCPLITDKGVEAIARCCPNLELLSLSGNERVTDSSILVLAQLCCHLRWLGCRDCNKITDTSLVQVAGQCPGLEHLSVCSCIGVTDVTLGILAKHCPMLKTLELDDTHVTSKGVTTFLQVHKQLSSSSSVHLKCNLR